MNEGQKIEPGWLRIWRALVLSTALIVALPTMADTNDKLTDTEISQGVDDEISEDAATPANEIRVDTAEGIVTLSGNVDNALARDRAEAIATTIRGVRAVINNVEVTPRPKSDSAIKRDCKDALVYDEVAELWDFDLTVSDGVVTLSGTVDSFQEKAHAARVVKGVEGVQELKNLVAVNYDTDRTDTAIYKEVESALRWDRYIDDALIGVAVEDGKVILSGTVGSLAEKRRAKSQAWVAGVTEVDGDQLRVRWWARDDRLREDKYVSLTDKETRDAVIDALLYDPDIASYKVMVDADGGYVTLRGTVGKVEAKRAAARTARSVVGVWGVDNKIKVAASELTNRQVRTRVTDALERSPYVNRYDLSVSVASGIVYLSGEVDSQFEKGEADSIAGRQKGVTAVRNLITINNNEALTYNPYVDQSYIYDYDWYSVGQEGNNGMSDWEIRKEIRDELWWSPYVDEDDVTVAVDNGVATLTGTVGTLSERDAATENALEGGAWMVDNDLIVAYGPAE